MNKERKNHMKMMTIMMMPKPRHNMILNCAHNKATVFTSGRASFFDALFVFSSLFRNPQNFHEFFDFRQYCALLSLRSKRSKNSLEISIAQSYVLKNRISKKLKCHSYSFQSERHPAIVFCCCCCSC